MCRPPQASPPRPTVTTTPSRRGPTTGPFRWSPSSPTTTGDATSRRPTGPRPTRVATKGPLSSGARSFSQGSPSCVCTPTRASSTTTPNRRSQISPAASYVPRPCPSTRCSSPGGRKPCSSRAGRGDSPSSTTVCPGTP